MAVHLSFLDEKLLAVSQKLETCGCCTSDYKMLLDVLKSQSSKKMRDMIKETDASMSVQSSNTGSPFLNQNATSWRSFQEKKILEYSSSDSKSSPGRVDIQEFCQKVNRVLERFTDELESHPGLLKSELKKAATRFIDDALSKSFDKLTCKTVTPMLEPAHSHPYSPVLFRSNEPGQAMIVQQAQESTMRYSQDWNVFVEALDTLYYARKRAQNLSGSN